jgi:hypothetical protein
VSTYRVVPLAWLPQAYGLSNRVRDGKAPTQENSGFEQMYGWTTWEQNRACSSLLPREEAGALDT